MKIKCSEEILKTNQFIKYITRELLLLHTYEAFHVSWITANSPIDFFLVVSRPKISPKFISGI